MNRFLIPLLMALLSFGSSGNVLAAVDLKVTANPDPALPGERIVYALTVTNTGTQSLTGVVVKDLFSSAVTVDGFNLPDGGTCPGISCQTGERITWSIGSLGAKTSRTVHYEATVNTGGSAPPAGTVLSNLAELTYDGGGKTVVTDIVAGSGPGLELSITDSRDPVVPGETVTYTLAFGNSGTTNVFNTLLRAPLPAGTTFVSASPGGSVVNGNVEWALGTVLSGAVGERSFTVQVGGGVSAGDVVLANAQLADSLSSQSLVRAGTETSLAASTPVELYVTANPDPALPGERVEYTLTVTNTGALPLTGVVVQDLPSTSVSVDGFNLADGGTCPGTSCQVNELITWNIGGLAAKTSRTVHYEATVNTGGSAPPAGTVLSNLATLVHDGGTGSSTTSLVVGNTPGLELLISDDRDPVVPGETVTYTLAFGNSGTTNVLNTLLRAPLPAGTTFVSASPGGSVVSGNVEWALGTVLSGAVGERSFTVQVDSGASAGGVVIAGAQLADSVSSQSLVRAETETILAVSTPVELYVTANPDPALPGERVEYTLTVTNTGALPLTGVVVQDLPSTSVSVDGFNLADGGTCPGISCQVNELITWNIGGLAAKTSRTVHYEATVNTGGSAPPAGTVLSNLAELNYDGGATAVTSSVLVGSAPGLELSITDDRDPVVPGETITYTLNFGNASTVNSSNLLLRAPLPAGTTLLSVSPGGSVVSGNVEWALGTVLSGAVGERSFTVQVDSGASAGGVVLADAQLADSVSSQSLVRAETETILAVSTPVELYVTANPDPALPGERVEYTLTVTNTGALPLTGVVMQDLFPDDVNVNGFILADGGTCPGTSCQVGERITWNIGSLAAKTSRTVHYEATVRTGSSTPPAGTVLSNLATMVYDGGAGSSTTNVVVGNGSGLELSITDDRDPVVPGETLTYTLAFGNRTGSAISNLTLRAPIPQGTTFISATAGGVLEAGAVKWDIKNRLIPGAVDVRHFTVSVTGAVAGDVLQTSAQLVDSTSGIGFVRTETVTEIAESTPLVRLVSAFSADPVVSGGLNYSLSVTNTSGIPVTGVVVSELIPQFVTVSGSAILDGGVCPGGSCQTGERITWNIGSMVAGVTQIVRYQAVMAFNLQNGTNLRSRATLIYDVGSGSSDIDVPVGVVIDADEDGLPDQWELDNFGNTNANTGGDFDKDGLNNLQEFLLDTSPVDSDSDMDGMPDGWEVSNGLDPLDNTDAALDGDSDGFSNLEEFLAGSDPNNPLDTPRRKEDIVIDFGSIGLWARMNDATWKKLNNGSPDKVIVGDVDGNGIEDVIADFSSTLGGIFIKRNGGGWGQLHNSTPELMVVGDLDNNGKDDIVIDFGGIGLWARMNDTNWRKLSNGSPTQLVVGDMDGNGADDVIAVFSSGIFVKRNLGGWRQLHNFIPEAMTVGDLDGNGMDDVVIDFGGIALWARMNDSSWRKLHNSSPGLIATGDLDGNGADDVIATFSGSGLWQKLNLGGWSQLNPNVPDEVITADVDGSGREDIVAKFGSTIGGLFVKRNQGGWRKLHNTSPDSLAAGHLDSN